MTGFICSSKNVLVIFLLNYTSTTHFLHDDSFSKEFMLRKVCEIIYMEASLYPVLHDLLK